MSKLWSSGFSCEVAETGSYLMKSDVPVILGSGRSWGIPAQHTGCLEAYSLTHLSRKPFLTTCRTSHVGRENTVGWLMRW